MLDRSLFFVYAVRMKTILSAITGSTAYGTATEDSDIDRTEICVEKTLWVSDKPVNTYHKAIPGGNDITRYEVGHFINLLRSNSPSIIEFAHLPHEYIHLDGEMILYNLPAFLSYESVYTKYTSMIEAQIKYLEEAEELERRKAKTANHIWRFAHHGLDILTTGTAQPFLDQSLFEKYWDYDNMSPKQKAAELRILRSGYDVENSPLRFEQNLGRIDSVLHGIRVRN